MSHNITFKDFIKSVNNKSSRTCVMGIVNVTPDSFSDGGKFFTLKSAYEHSKYDPLKHKVHEYLDNL